MKKHALLFVASLAVNFLAGCSGSSDSSDGSDGSAFACVTPTSDFQTHHCTAFESMPDYLRDGNCDTAGGETIVASCPTDDLAATCTVPNSNFQSITYYFYSDSDLAEGQTFCKDMHGTFDSK